MAYTDRANNQKIGHRRGDFPEAEKAANEVLSLPIDPILVKVRDAEKIALFDYSVDK